MSTPTYSSQSALLPLTDAQLAIAEECDAVKQLLLSKNAKYHNSAMSPLRVFSRASAAEGLNVRLDDKLSRIRNMVQSHSLDASDGLPGDELLHGGEDTVLDLIGYLILKRVERRMRQAQGEVAR